MTTTALTKEPEFVYPTSRQYPFSEALEQIVRGLEDRNWDVPGIEVEFYVYGSGNAKKREVSCIKGTDFRLRISADSSNTLTIPGKELDVYDDESGPTLYVYVGNDWDNDRQSFIDHRKVNSKLREQPRTYLEYKGECRCNKTNSWHLHRGRRSPVLAHTNDLGREYEPEEGEAKSYRTQEVMEEFASWLNSELLPFIGKHPVQQRIDIFKEDRIPFPDALGPIFAFGENRDAERVKTGNRNPNLLEPKEQYGLAGSGYRLLSLLVARGDTTPEVVYDGFLWAGFGTIDKATDIAALEVPGHYRWPYRETAVFRITPNRANGVFVADNWEFDRTQDETMHAALKEEPVRNRRTDEEVSQACLARARTIIPISEYAPGSFMDPVVLFNRELDFNEVELVIEAPRR